MSKMLLTTTSPFQKKLLQTAKGRRRPLCKALLVGEGGAKRRMRGSLSEIRLGASRAETDPSPGSHLSMRSDLSHKGRGDYRCSAQSRHALERRLVLQSHAQHHHGRVRACERDVGVEDVVAQRALDPEVARHL